MPPLANSRYQFCEELTDSEGRLYLSDRIPFGYVERADNATHTVRQGETLFSLAERYFSPKPNAAWLYWVIADFQPEPVRDLVRDPTIALPPGLQLVIPSRRTLDEEILNPERAKASIL